MKGVKSIQNFYSRENQIISSSHLSFQFLPIELTAYSHTKRIIQCYCQIFIQQQLYLYNYLSSLPMTQLNKIYLTISQTLNVQVISKIKEITFHVELPMLLKYLCRRKFQQSECQSRTSQQVGSARPLRTQPWIQTQSLTSVLCDTE